MAMAWERWSERLRYRFVPPFVDWLVHLSTYQARVTLQRAPMCVLVDTNVFTHSVTHETQWVAEGYSEQWKRPLGRFARVPVHALDCNSEDSNNVRYLPSIAYLAKRGFLKLKTSTELMVERHRLSAAWVNGGGHYDYSVFRGVKVECFDRLPLGSYTFTDLSDRHLQRARLKASDDPRFQAIVAQLGQGNSQDAWHIRTAEAHGCFCFLTMDFKLLKRVGKKQLLEPFKSLRTKIMTPEALGKHLGLKPIPTHFFSYHDASFPLRDDLSRSDDQRFQWPF